MEFDRGFCAAGLGLGDFAARMYAPRPRPGLTGKLVTAEGDDCTLGDEGAGWLELGCRRLTEASPDAFSGEGDLQSVGLVVVADMAAF